MYPEEDPFVTGMARTSGGDAQGAMFALYGNLPYISLRDL
jgi:hypothetical protein